MGEQSLAGGEAEGTCFLQHVNRLSGGGDFGTLVPTWRRRDLQLEALGHTRGSSTQSAEVPGLCLRTAALPSSPRSSCTASSRLISLAVTSGFLSSLLSPHLGCNTGAGCRGGNKAGTLVPFVGRELADRHACNSSLGLKLSQLWTNPVCALPNSHSSFDWLWCMTACPKDSFT